MATISTTPHPVFGELRAILGNSSVPLCPDDTEFKKCRGIVKDGEGNKQPCKNKIASSKCEATKNLHEMLRGVTSWCITDAKTDDVRLYLQNMHCWAHRKGVEAKFDKWAAEMRQNRLEGSRILGPGEMTLMSGFKSNPPTWTRPSSSPRPSLEGEAGSTTQKTAPPPTDPAIVGSLDAPTIDASRQRNDHVTQKSVDIVETPGFKMVGLGLVRAAGLRRQVSLRDRSPLMQEIYRHLTLTDQKPGVVYILEHVQIPELWKIGWTGRSAEERLGDHDNCYGKAARVLYQTEGGSFSGAYKAEKLAHAFLRENNLDVTECDRCGKGHTEWFRGPEGKVRGAVTLMENLVKLPGYELRDGKMRLSAEIHALIDKTWEMSMDKLSELAATKETNEQTPSSLDTEVNGMADAIGKLGIDAGPGASRMLVATTSEAGHHQPVDVADVSATLTADTSAAMESPLRQPDDGGLTELPRIQGDVGSAQPSAAAPDAKRGKMRMMARGFAKPLVLVDELRTNVKATIQEQREFFDVFIDEVKDAVQEHRDSKGSRRTSSGRLSFGS